jgi:diguanylate cyclase (GGDEF)-like protein
LVVLGALASFAGAWQVHNDANQRARVGFTTSAAQVASRLQLAMVHEEDLVVGAGSVFVRNPQTTEAAFLQWTRSTAAFARYPELQGLSEITMVPASQLNAFAVRIEQDPPGPLSANGTLQVSPAGLRPYYCLQTVAQSRHPALAVPAGIDICQTSLGRQLLATRDTGQTLYLPYKTGTLNELALGNAIYKGDAIPATVAARRAALIGWTGIEILPKVLLVTSLDGDSRTQLFFHYGSPTSNVTFADGTAPAHSQSTSISLRNGWELRVVGPASARGLLSNGASSALLFGGIAFAMVLALLIFILGTGRSRALRRVEEGTNELAFQAFHDALTGLPNRPLILDRMERMLARTRRRPRLVAALFLDLDNFKDINDTLGHRAGDELLIAVAERLTRLLRGEDTVGRIGGDEFVILTEGSATSSAAEVLAERVLEDLARPFDIPSAPTPISVTASIGMANGSVISPDELLQRADIALYHAKAAGKFRYAVYADRMKDTLDQKHRLDVELHAALGTDQFFLEYQPTVTLATGEMAGVEALLRWRHPTRGILEPSAFIPALETTGLIIPVGRRVLETACRAAAVWNSLDDRITVAVNVSPKQLQRDSIIEDVEHALSSSGLDPTLLVLELTETTLMRGAGNTVGRLLRLRRSGLRLAIDDFGTGFSSLAYLQQFPIDVLKIDQSFIAGLADAGKSRAIIQTFVQLGRALNLEVVAEGIESEDQRSQLAALGVDTGQGYYLCPPLDLEDVVRSRLGPPASPLHLVDNLP